MQIHPILQYQKYVKQNCVSEIKIILILKVYSQNCKGRKNKATVMLKTRRFDNIDLAVIISSVSKAVQNRKRSFFQFRTALVTLLMMTAEAMLSKCPAVKITAALLFLELFSSHIYHVVFPKLIVFTLI